MPYLLFVVTVSALPGFQGVGIIQIAAVSAFGAAIGKFVSYGLGYGARQTLSGNQARFDSFRKLMGGSAFLVAFFFAASPLPDDIIFIPLGIVRYSPPKTFVALYSGKFVLTAFVAYVARRSQGTLEEVLGGGIYLSILSAVVVILVALLLMRVDWESILVEGRKGALRRLVKNILKRPGRPSKESGGQTEHGSGPTAT